MATTPNAVPAGGTLRGRGAAVNPGNRFDPVRYERHPDLDPEDTVAPGTQLLKDTSRSILSKNTSPDVPFTYSFNPYRGCEHGCVYCYARPTHEYLGFSAGLDFETRILVKENAAALLRKELARPGWEPQAVALSGNTDPYQPAERELGITRGCLEVLLDFRNPVGIITKSRLVTRDIDVLRELAAFDAVSVTLSITTLDAGLAAVMEPRAASPGRRLDAVRRLSEAGIPVGVNVAPVVPGLTDHEIPSIIRAAAEAGAERAGWIMLRLPHGVRMLFEDWLRRHRPARADKVLNRIRHIRGGDLNDSRYATRMRGEGIFAREIEALFRLACRHTGLDARRYRPLSSRHFRRRAVEQISLF